METILTDKFTEIYQKNFWGSPESVSGTGSTKQNTLKLRQELLYLFAKYNIKSMLDIPCGDFNWMQYVDLTGIEYIGADIVPELIESNKVKFPDIDFRVLDIVSSDLPKVDLIFVRDCLGHLSDYNVNNAINNMVKSGSKYILATSFTKYDYNTNIVDGGWRCINLLIKPFKLKPQYLINEDCREGYPYYNDKCMILFDINDIKSKRS